MYQHFETISVMFSINKQEQNFAPENLCEKLFTNQSYCLVAVVEHTSTQTNMFFAIHTYEHIARFAWSSDYLRQTFGFHYFLQIYNGISLQ